MIPPAAPARSVVFDDRAQELLSTLTLKVPLITDSQAAGMWWSEPKGQGAAACRVKELADAGWLCRDAVTAHPELSLEKPLFIWEPEDPEPHFGVLAEQAARRIPSRSEQVVVVRATEKAARLFGGKPGVLKAPSINHDVQLAGLYLHFLRHRPADAEAWISEATLAAERQGQVLPDAALIDDAGVVHRVIEWAGRYAPERLRRLHDDCADRGLPYELW